LSFTRKSDVLSGAKVVIPAAGSNEQSEFETQGIKKEAPLNLLQGDPVLFPAAGSHKLTIKNEQVAIIKNKRK